MQSLAASVVLAALSVPAQAQQSWDLSRCQRLLTEAKAKAGHVCAPEHLEVDFAQLLKTWGIAPSEPNAKAVHDWAEIGVLEGDQEAKARLAQLKADLKQAEANQKQAEVELKQLEASLEPQNLPPDRIKLEVNSSKDLSGLVTSFLTRELLQLPKVVVTDSNPRYVLSVVAIETRNQAGTITGYAISYTLLHRVDMNVIKENIAHHGVGSEGLKSLDENLPGPVYYHLDQRVLVGPMNNLKSACERLVADFDAGQLEPGRRALERAFELLKGKR